MTATKVTSWTSFPSGTTKSGPVETVEKYMQAESDGSPLIRMPTGTGKSGVIATVAPCLRNIENVLVLTPLDGVEGAIAKGLE
jgi:hypothetical protein